MLIPFRLFQGFQDEVFFMVFQRKQLLIWQRLLQEVLGQVFRNDLIPFCNDGGMFDHIFQFAYISRPRMGKEEFHYFGTDTGHLSSLFTAEFLQEVRSEQGDVIFPLSEGRDEDGIRGIYPEFFEDVPQLRSEEGFRVAEMDGQIVSSMWSQRT